MKHLIITLFIAAAAMTVQAQQMPADTNKLDTIIVRHIVLLKAQNILNFSYNWLPKSMAPSMDVSTIIPMIQQVFPQLQPYVKPKAAAKPKGNNAKPNN